MRNKGSINIMRKNHRILSSFLKHINILALLYRICYIKYCCLFRFFLIFIFFCTSRYGWGWKNFTKEANAGKGLKVQRWMRGYMCYVLPVLVAVILVLGLIRH